MSTITLSSKSWKFWPLLCDVSLNNGPRVFHFYICTCEISFRVQEHVYNNIIVKVLENLTLLMWHFRWNKGPRVLKGYTTTKSRSCLCLHFRPNTLQKFYLQSLWDLSVCGRLCVSVPLLRLISGLLWVGNLLNLIVEVQELRSRGGVHTLDGVHIVRALDDW